MENEDIELIKGASEFYKIYEDIKDLDLTKEQGLRRLESHFDLNNLVDYIVLQTYFNNVDWPHNNIKAWRIKGESVWKFILFDMDAAFKTWTNNPFLRFYSELTGGPFNKEHDFLFQKFFTSKELRNRIYSRYLELRKDILSPHRMISVLDSLAAETEISIKRQSDRWTYPRSYKKWKEGTEEINDFLISRDLFYLNALSNFAPPTVYPNPTSGDIFVSDAWVDKVEKIVIADLSGRQILALSESEIVFPIDLSRHLTLPGVYLMDWTAEGIKMRKKVVYID